MSCLLDLGALTPAIINESRFYQEAETDLTRGGRASQERDLTQPW